jgi:hypothetical protein
MAPRSFRYSVFAQPLSVTVLPFTLLCIALRERSVIARGRKGDLRALYVGVHLLKLRDAVVFGEGIHRATPIIRN